ncbi:MAG TPA: PAS domain-containing protein [Alphaproteobacteria bacterium]|nr:PAS domain-containing protein [Alphaproteobacteria bacterium]
MAAPITDARIQQGYDYWRRIAAGRPMPMRADLDPLHIPQLLPHVMLVDVIGPSRYRYRLIGTECVNGHGMDATGLELDAVLKGEQYRRYVIGLYDRAVEERRAVYSESLLLSLDDTQVERHVKVLFMPLSPDGAAVNMIFVVQILEFVDEGIRGRHFIDARPYKEIALALL